MKLTKRRNRLRPGIRNLLKRSKLLIRTVKKIRIFRYFRIKDWLDLKKVWLFWRVEPYTTVGYYRLNNAYDIARLVGKDSIEGDIIECGSWKGGCVATMAYVAGKARTRKIWIFDSFVGLPEPGKIDGKLAQEFSHNRNSGKLAPINECVATARDVKEIFFKKLNVNRENVNIIKGWIQDTMPKTKGDIKKIAILRLDVDWYETTKICLENLYDKVVCGGYIIFDDYGHWEGCRRAVDEFFQSRGIFPDFKVIDYTEKYMIKKA